VEKVREYIHTINGFKSVTIVERDENYGLAKSIITGVTEIVNSFGKIIVLEDDLLVSPYFLRYMNEALELYENKEQVMQVSGFMFDVSLHDTTDAIFLPYITSWGWGTWDRAWQKFDPKTSGYAKLKKDRKLRYAFNLDGYCNYFGMLENHLSGKYDTWDIQWYLSVFMSNALVLHPVQSLVFNTGFDGSGTHCDGRKQSSQCSFKSYSSFSFPERIFEYDLKHQVYRAVVGVDSANPFKRVLAKMTKIISRLR
jgi:hypothetical protein